MPNWIEGYMKVRGTPKKVRDFASYAFEYQKWNGKELVSVPAFQEGLNVYGTEDGVCVEIEVGKECYLKGSYRAFIPRGGYVYIDDIESDREVTGFFKIKQAWAFCIEDYVKLSKEFDVDIRIIGWERGFCIKQEAEILRGRDPVCKETKYDDWEWESECPDFGG